MPVQKCYLMPITLAHSYCVLDMKDIRVCMHFKLIGNAFSVQDTIHKHTRSSFNRVRSVFNCFNAACDYTSNDFSMVKCDMVLTVLLFFHFHFVLLSIVCVVCLLWCYFDILRHFLGHLHTLWSCCTLQSRAHCYRLHGRTHHDQSRLSAMHNYAITCTWFVCYAFGLIWIAMFRICGTNTISFFEFICYAKKGWKDSANNIGGSIYRLTYSTFTSMICYLAKLSKHTVRPCLCVFLYLLRSAQLDCLMYLISTHIFPLFL